MLPASDDFLQEVAQCSEYITLGILFHIKMLNHFPFIDLQGHFHNRSEV